MPSRRATDLEAFTLGLIWRHGPCTAYMVRRLMADSPSSQWSGSAGAIYPLVRRLERRGLLRSSAAVDDGRRTRNYVITRRGITALQSWIGPPLADDAVTVAHDPLRSRARFLGVLSAAEQRAWVAGAIEAMDTVAARIRAWHELYGGEDPMSRAMTRSGELDVRSRTQWLRELARVVG